MEFIKHISSRGLPKTGQVTEHYEGDDGTYEAGWWVKRLNANNRTRFVTKTIGGDKVVFDRATGLCWAADEDSAGCNNGIFVSFTTAITYANALDFAGFTDWRVPNIKEAQSIVNYGLNDPALDVPPFTVSSLCSWWSSTIFNAVPTMAWNYDMGTGAVAWTVLTDEHPVRCVRGGV